MDNYIYPFVFFLTPFTPIFGISIQNMKLKRQKTQNVKLPMTTVDRVRRFKKENEKLNPDSKIIIGRFVDNAVLEKLANEEKNFQIKP